MRHWTLENIVQKAREQLSDFSCEILTNPYPLTIDMSRLSAAQKAAATNESADMWRQSSMEQATIIATLTGCLCRDTLYQYFLSMIDFQDEHFGRVLSREEKEEDSPEAIQFRAERNSLAFLSTQMSWCHVHQGKFNCYCDEHPHEQ